MRWRSKKRHPARRGPADFTDLVLTVSAEMVRLADGDMDEKRAANARRLEAALQWRSLAEIP
ncbi:hypothetical protein [Candidatus Amarolinea dominans]|uniref:hypothetical protein n=1 Tax=Candidatus Amarolinea dominans TaxID=3140696 RepID=UPI0031CCB1F7